MRACRLNAAVWVLVVWFTACTSTPENAEVAAPTELTWETVYTFTQVRFDSERNENWIMSPPYFLRDRLGPQATLVARWEPGHAPRYQLYFFHALNAWAYYERALTEFGNELDFEFFGRTKTGPDVYEERVGAWVTREMMEAAAADRFVVIIAGRNNREDVVLPGFFVEGFVRKVDRILRDRGNAGQVDAEAREIEEENRKRNSNTGGG